jgi:hypothetical protein
MEKYYVKLRGEYPVVSGENFEKQEKRESVMYNAFA